MSRESTKFFVATVDGGSTELGSTISGIGSEDISVLIQVYFKSAPHLHTPAEIPSVHTSPSVKQVSPSQQKMSIDSAFSADEMSDVGLAAGSGAGFVKMR